MDIPHFYRTLFKPSGIGDELAEIYARTAEEDIHLRWLFRANIPLAQIVGYYRVYASAVDACLWLNDYTYSQLIQANIANGINRDSDVISVDTVKGIYQGLLTFPQFVDDARTNAWFSMIKYTASDDANYLQPYSSLIK